MKHIDNNMYIVFHSNSEQCFAYLKQELKVCYNYIAYKHISIAFRHCPCGCLIFIYPYSFPVNRRAQENMIDVFGAMNTEIADKQLAEKIFLNENPNHELVKRILVHLATKSKSPHEVI